MDLIERIKGDLTEALKSGESLVVETLRGALSGIHNMEIEKRSEGELSEEEVVKVLQKEAKKRRESADVYTDAGRSELADKERAELEIISVYLPSQLEQSEVDEIVREVIKGGEDNFGNIMKSVMAKVSGRADAKVVSEIVKEQLG